jgi:hypothetical protein
MIRIGAFDFATCEFGEACAPHVRMLGQVGTQKARQKPLAIVVLLHDEVNGTAGFHTLLEYFATAGSELSRVSIIPSMSASCAPAEWPLAP